MSLRRLGAASATGRADAKAIDEAADALHSELSEALITIKPEPGGWRDLTNKEQRRLVEQALAATGNLDNPAAVHLAFKALATVERAMRLKLDFTEKVYMEVYRPGVRQHLKFSINKLTQKKILESLGATNEGCDFQTDDGITVVLRKQDIGCITFYTISDEDEDREDALAMER
jgi:hypothetical protein